MDFSQYPALDNNSIPVQNGQRRQIGEQRVYKVAKRRHSSLPRPGRRNEYEEARTLFDGAEARSKYYMFFKKPEGEEDNFANLNFKKRLDAVRAELGNNNFTMKKFSFKNKKRETEYKLGVCVDTEEDMKKLLNVKVIANCNVIGEENIAKNSIKGLIIDHEDELVGMDKDELIEAVSSEGIKDIVRYGESKVIEISFGGQTKPDKVYFWEKLSFPVQHYIDPPARCFKCQEYGHMSRTCRNDFRCYNCGLRYAEKHEHNPKECKREKCCVNCKGAHASGYKKCEVHILEKKWASICFHQNITRQEAKARYPDGVVPKYSDAVGRGNQESNPQEPVQQNPKEDNSTQEIDGLKKQVQSLENMLRTVLTAINRNAVTDGDNDQTGDVSQGVLLVQLQEQVERMSAAQEQQKLMYAQCLDDGNKKYKLLEKQYEESQAENIKLSNQVRDLMKFKVEHNAKDLQNNISNKQVTNNNSNQTPPSRGGGNTKPNSANSGTPRGGGGGSVPPRGGGSSEPPRGGGGGGSGKGKKN